MNTRLRSVLVWGLWIGTLATALAAGALRLSERDQGLGGLVVNGLLVLIPFVYATVGLVVAFRVPGNRIGSILLFGGLLFGVDVFASRYPELAISLELPGAVFVAWIGQMIFFPAIIMVVAVPSEAEVAAGPVTSRSGHQWTSPSRRP